MNELTPKQIVAELDKYIIGQAAAKKAVAVALRNRSRRMKLDQEMQAEVTPKNLLMIGPTGVGKTEIARRLAKIVNAPFIKVEATKFTEVGYVGRDVEAMVRDLVDVAYRIKAADARKQVRNEASQKAEEQLVKMLVPNPKEQKQSNPNPMEMLKQLNSGNFDFFNQQQQEAPVDGQTQQKRAEVAEKLRRGFLENDEVTIDVVDESPQNANPMLGQLGVDLSNSLAGMLPSKMVKRTLKVKDAREVLIKQQADKLIDKAQVANEAVQLAENAGIIFIDEIDKIAAKNNNNAGEVSRQGVQRDILPIVEGSQVATKYGPVSTSHILFIGSGAFSESKPSDLIAELQGRFPIRVELADLSEKDFVNILTQPQNSLIRQYQALVGTDNITLTFSQEAVAKMAQIAFDLNHQTENIGARRLHTIMEKLLEDLLYEGPDMQMGEIMITESYVEDKLGGIAHNKDLSDYIL